MNEVTGFSIDQGFAVPSMPEQERMVEALLFASDAPLTMADLATRMPQGCDLPGALRALRRRYDGRGVELADVAGGFAFRTAADLGFLMASDAVETRKLSRAAIETLAIVAYHQPVTRAEIEEIRGVSVSGGTLDLLMEIGWVKLGRRRESPGRPTTLVVTTRFLEHFGLANAADLPGIAELRAAGMLDNRPPPGGGPPVAGTDADAT